MLSRAIRGGHYHRAIEAVHIAPRRAAAGMGMGRRNAVEDAHEQAECLARCTATSAPTHAPVPGRLRAPEEGHILLLLPRNKVRLKGWHKGRHGHVAVRAMLYDAQHWRGADAAPTLQHVLSHRHAGFTAGPGASIDQKGQASYMRWLQQHAPCILASAPCGSPRLACSRCNRTRSTAWEGRLGCAAARWPSPAPPPPSAASATRCRTNHTFPPCAVERQWSGSAPAAEKGAWG